MIIFVRKVKIVLPIERISASIFERYWTALLVDMIWWYMYYDKVLLLSETVPDRDEWTVGVSTANSAGDDQDRQRETIRTPLSEERTEQTRTGPHNNALIRKINKSIKPTIYQFFLFKRKYAVFLYIQRNTMYFKSLSFFIERACSAHYALWQW